MAERMLVAFGRYLRNLRERRGLSLDEVEALTRAYPEPVNKAYLSRVENGKSRIAFSRMVALCRAYEYPIDAAAERLALDLEVDGRAGVPSTTGRVFKDLNDEGRRLFQAGYRVDAYAVLRDAVAVRETSPLSPTMRNLAEQSAVAVMNCAAGAANLGRLRLATEEYRHVESLDVLSPKLTAVLYCRMSIVHNALGETEAALRFADRAIEITESESDREYLGYFLSARAMALSSKGENHASVLFHQRAFRAMRDAGFRGEAANVLLNLSEQYRATSRVAAAKRAARSCYLLARELELPRLRSRAAVVLGELLEEAGSLSDAEERWLEAAKIAEEIGDRTLAFKVKFLLYRLARHQEKDATARALARTLRRLAPWIAPNVQELTDFRTLDTRASSRPT